MSEIINVSLKICGKNNRWDKLLSREYCVYAKTENVKSVDFRKKKLDAKKCDIINVWHTLIPYIPVYDV